MSFRLLTAGGDFLVDSSGNYLVWQGGDTGVMSLVITAPTMELAATAPTITLTASED